MPRPERLLQMMQVLRATRPPIKAEYLAAELGISLRSVYRDINALRSTGAIIDGAAGFGYTLVEDPALPPMMFNADEMEALVLGLREVIEVGDPVLSKAANDVLGKVTACLPDRMRGQFQNAALHVKRFHERPEIAIDVAQLRKAAREEVAIDIDYRDLKGAATQRRLLPLTIVFMDHALMLLAYCELRRDFRTFRLDRIETLKLSGQSFRPRRVPMLRECLQLMRLADGHDSASAPPPNTTA